MSLEVIISDLGIQGGCRKKIQLESCWSAKDQNFNDQNSLQSALIFACCRMMVILRSCYDSFYLQNSWVCGSSRLLPEYSISAGWDVRHVELVAKSSCTCCSYPAWALRLQGGSVWSIFTSWICGSNLCIDDLQPTWQTSWMSWSATSFSHSF